MTALISIQLAFLAQQLFQLNNNAEKNPTVGPWCKLTISIFHVHLIFMHIRHAENQQAVGL